jgi:hypothetical protein
MFPLLVRTMHPFKFLHIEENKTKIHKKKQILTEENRSNKIIVLLSVVQSIIIIIKDAAESQSRECWTANEQRIREKKKQQPTW